MKMEMKLIEDNSYYEIKYRNEKYLLASRWYEPDKAQLFELYEIKDKELTNIAKTKLGKEILKQFVLES